MNFFHSDATEYTVIHESVIKVNHWKYSLRMLSSLKGYLGISLDKQTR